MNGTRMCAAHVCPCCGDWWQCDLLQALHCTLPQVALCEACWEDEEGAMSAPRGWRYEPRPELQHTCTACWAAAAGVRVLLGRTWVASYCAACAEEHRSRHVPPAQRDFWEVDVLPRMNSRDSQDRSLTPEAE